MKVKVFAFAVAVLVSGVVAGQPAVSAESRGSATAAGPTGAAPGSGGSGFWARKYPFLDPDWTSTSFYPPEYCRYLIRIDRSDAIYWQIKAWCDKQSQRRLR